ncbi:sulfofructose kinase [Bradyrhizobium sp. AZCC 1678]
MTDSRMNFQDNAPKIPARILCIGMPVRDLTFHTPGVPGRGSKENATAFDEICGGNALNGAIGIARLGGRASICGPMGDAKEASSRFIFDQMAHEGIETKHLIHMPGLVTPISAVMIDPSGERTIVTFRDPELWHVKLPDFDTLLDDCAAILTESRCAEFCTELCAEAVRRGIPVIVDVDRAMSLREGLLNASSHLVFSSEPLQETADVTDDAQALKKIAKLTPSFLAGTPGPEGHDLARREREDPGDPGLPGAYGGHPRRRRRVPRRVCAGHHREAGIAASAAIRLRRRSAEMHPLRRRFRRPATC